jgi:alkaline phosphatase D
MMIKSAISFGALIVLSLMAFTSCNKSTVEYSSSWEYQPDRVWAGPEYWANRLQDWHLEGGKLKCINNSLGLRTVHLLTHQIGEDYGKLDIELFFGLHPASSRQGNNGWAGILLGAGEGKIDYRASALVHHSPGDAGGILVAVNELGQVVFLDNTNNRELIGSIQKLPENNYPDSLLLKINIYLNEDSTFTVSASAIDYITRNQISHNNLTKIPKERIRGNIALAVNHIERGFEGSNYWFGRLKLKGTILDAEPGRRFGPFMGVQHTLSNGTLKLTAQLPPVGNEDDTYVRMWYRDRGAITWQETDSTVIVPGPFIAPFRLDNWNSEIDHEYRLSYRLNDMKGRKRTYFYTGIIKAEPVGKQELIAGAFSCISHTDGTINGNNWNYPERLWFPHNDFVRSVEKQKPDILFFTGDQIYEGRPTPADFSTPENTELDYLYKWYIFLWSTGELMRNTPTICILDDHDVYHGNIWGANGKAAPAYPPDSVYPAYYNGLKGHWQQDQGGFKLRASTVNMIQATQTSHLPDPYDATPVEQGIEVYYTDLNYGRISFAILEDRKFKSAPSVMLPEARVVNGFAQNRYISGRRLDHPEAKLLGERQLDFIEAWTEDWKNSDMKVAVSQTIFANLSTYPDTFHTDAGTPGLLAPPPGVIPEGYRLARDMDSNGWPQTGRNNALKALRKGFAVMIAGDQHLGSLVQMGVDTWDDAGYSFCVPAIGNLWPRRWFPQEPGIDRLDDMPAYTGKYFDGFGNRVNVWAVANPVQTGKEPAGLYDRAVGYGIIRFNKASGEITFECWKRDADPDYPKEGLYPGWPKTISLMENYNRPVRSWLPNYQVEGLNQHPLFQVIDESTGEILYTVRVPATSFQPGVFSYGGDYTIKIGDSDTDNFRILENVRARYIKNEEPVIIQF